MSAAKIKFRQLMRFEEKAVFYCCELMLKLFISAVVYFGYAAWGQCNREAVLYVHIQQTLTLLFYLALCRPAEFK